MQKQNQLKLRKCEEDDLKYFYSDFLEDEITDFQELSWKDWTCLDDPLNYTLNGNWKKNEGTVLNVDI